MYSVTEAATRIGRSPSSVRNYTDQFGADYMSQGARAAGANRLYDSQDLAILATITDLKKARKPLEEIKATLDAGELVDLAPEQQERPQRDDIGGPDQLALISQLTIRAAKFEGQVEQLDKDMEDTKQQLESERSARLAAEIRATKAETELEILRGPPGQEPAPEAQSEATKRPWWKFWQ